MTDTRIESRGSTLTDECDSIHRGSVLPGSEDTQPAGRKHSRLKKAFAVAALCVAGAFGGMAYNYQRLFHEAVQADAAFIAGADAVVVFTGRAARDRAGFDLCKTGLQVLFLTGCGDPMDVILKEAEYNPEDDIPLERLKLGRRALNTGGNAIEIADWLKRNPQIRRVVFVTDASHMARAYLELLEEFQNRGLAQVDRRWVSVGGDNPWQGPWLKEAAKVGLRMAGLGHKRRILAYTPK